MTATDQSIAESGAYMSSPVVPATTAIAHPSTTIEADSSAGAGGANPFSQTQASGNRVGAIGTPPPVKGSGVRGGNGGTFLRVFGGLAASLILSNVLLVV